MAWLQEHNQLSKADYFRIHMSIHFRWTFMRCKRPWTVCSYLPLEPLINFPTPSFWYPWHNHNLIPQYNRNMDTNMRVVNRVIHTCKTLHRYGYNPNQFNQQQLHPYRCIKTNESPRKPTRIFSLRSKHDVIRKLTRFPWDLDGFLFTNIRPYPNPPPPPPYWVRCFPIHGL